MKQAIAVHAENAKWLDAESAFLLGVSVMTEMQLRDSHENMDPGPQRDEVRAELDKVRAIITTMVEASRMIRAMGIR